MQNSTTSYQALSDPQNRLTSMTYKINFHSPSKSQPHLSVDSVGYANSRNSIPIPHEKIIPPELEEHSQIELIKEIMEIPCLYCGSKKGYCRKIAGCASFSWCVCLFMTTGFLGFWVPFYMNRCYDIEIACIDCGYIKTTLEANCL